MPATSCSRLSDRPRMSKSRRDPIEAHLLSLPGPYTPEGAQQLNATEK
jgi:hypothetical protein